jgi:Zn-dependent peptidase ImmA (M78 family)
MTQTLNRMADLYSRLTQLGFPKQYVQDLVLPDWWCEDFEQSDGAVIDAASYAARRLNLNLDSLLEQNTSPSFNHAGNPKFKAIKGSDCNKFTIATALCNRVAELVSYACINEYQPLNDLSIENLRQLLLEKNGIINLEAALELCWERGIPVFHANNFPKAAKKFQGMVTYKEDRPVIVISFLDVSPSRLLFIAAHEMGHLYRGHISNKIGSMIDETVDSNSVDEKEIEANEFAGELLLGRPNMSYDLPDQYQGQRLADCAQRIAIRDKIDPGLVAWNYGHSKKQWGLATKAARLLEPNANAPLQINQYLENQIDWDKLSDDNQDHLKLFLKLEDD